MVAYSFASMFAPQVESLVKRHTVRADRKRHALPGEPVQLYAGMRTRQCRKLVEQDPICTSVRQIEIRTSQLVDCIIASIEIDGVPLHREEIEAFAAADGFAPERLRGWWPDAERKSARVLMGEFWLKLHRLGRFEGVIINWEPRA